MSTVITPGTGEERASAPRSGFDWRAVAAYGLMLAAAVGLFALIRFAGDGLTAPEMPVGATAVSQPKAGQVDVVFHVLATLAAVIALGFLLGRALAYVGQPPVIGEVLAGILLGPSLLGAISPDAMHLLIPGPETDPHGQVIAALKAVSQLGIVLYMFLVGLDLNAAQLRDRAAAAVTVAHTGIAIQFVLGAALALWLFPSLAPAGVAFTPFAFFFGVAMAITGFTVLSRILIDTGRDKTEVGSFGIACAAVDDVTAWCLVAVATGLAASRMNEGIAVVAGAVGFIVVMLTAVRPLVGRWCRTLDARPGPLPPAAVAVALAAVLLAAITTQAIGIHALIGAFLLGVVMPHDSKLAREMTRRLKDLVTVLLLPAFFALTGLRTEIGLVSGWQNWLVCGVIILVATLGKFGGTVAAARLTGHGWRSSAALGAMMNTRGLMALIVLDIGLGMGVISPTLFAMMVVMALVTTAATAPLLAWLLPQAAEPAGRSGDRNPAVAR